LALSDERRDPGRYIGPIPAEVDHGRGHGIDETVEIEDSLDIGAREHEHGENISLGLPGGGRAAVVGVRTGTTRGNTVTMDMIDLFDRATVWTGGKISGARQRLDEQTACDEWNGRRLVDHLLAGLAMFAAGPTGGTIAPSTGPPPELVGDDPVAQFEEARQTTITAYSQPGALDSMVKGFGGGVPAAQVLGIAFCDQLIHGWDLAKGTGQDAAMPADLAAAAWQMLEGRLTDESRGSMFKPAVPVADDASTQDKLLAYCGRTP
jgi:uncharacterized protein (TIGR03086 family)